MARFVIVSDSQRDLICDTGDLDYVPDPIRHRYGATSRLPLEDWFLYELDFVRTRLPTHNIFTLGSSLISGEQFITYLTICELDTLPGSFEELRQAVRHSDQAIRQKVLSLWEWNLCLSGDNRAALCIGWLDFAYFVQHRGDFLDTRHNRFMAGFASGDSRSTDYKVLHDGTLIEFDPAQLQPHDREVYERADEVSFEVVNREHGKTQPLTMV